MRQFTISSIRFRSNFVVLAVILFTSLAFGQPPSQFQELKPNQPIEREMTGAETHRYKFDLKADEFFQVRVEQKGVDITLKLLDANGNVLATMDSPNDKEGFETLTFVAAKAGSFILEVINSDAKLEKGIYSIEREPSRAATAKDKRRVEVEGIFVEGMAARITEGQSELAINKLKEALAGWEELGDDYLKKLTAQQLEYLAINAIVVEINKEYQEAASLLGEGQKLATKSSADSLSVREKLKKALSIHRSVISKAKDKTLLDKIRQLWGTASSDTLNSLKILEFYSKINEGLSLDAIAITHQILGEWQEYIDYLKLAIGVYQELLDDKSYVGIDPKKLLLTVKHLVAQDFDHIGATLDREFGQIEEAIKYKKQSLEIYRSLYQETQDRKYKIDEASSLSSIGLSYHSQSKDNAIAIEYLTKSLEIFQSLPNTKRKVAETFSLIANVNLTDFNLELARKNKEEALKIYRELDDKHGQSNALQMIAVMYWMLNDQPKFKEYINQNLAVLQSPDYTENFLKTAPPEPSGSQFLRDEAYNLLESSRLNDIGFSYRLLEDYPKSLEYYKKALEVARLSKYSDVRSILSNIAFSLAKLEKWDQASEYYKQALEISRKQKTKEHIAGDLQDIGWTLLESGKLNESLTYLSDALITYQSAGVDENKTFRPSYSSLLIDLSRTHYALGNKRLAIFYGKRAVNAMQGERQRLQNLDPVSQKGFLERKEKHYRRLADWLIAEGRVAEAEQVLPIIKADEYFDYLRRDPKVAKQLLDRISLTDDERDALNRFDEITRPLTVLGKEYDELKQESLKFAAGTFPKQTRLDELNGKLADAQAAFNKFLEELDARFRNSASNPTGLGATEVSAMRALLNRLNQPRAVIISTIVGEDRLNLIVTTTEASQAHTVEIKAADLNKLVLKFRAAVKNPNIDPRMAGKELYDVLFPSDLQKEMANIKADTIVWSLDGTLRYAPLAALWDGKQYLMERYASSVITLANRSKLNQPSSGRTNLTALGVGVSQGGTITGADGALLAFDSLDAVPEELCNVVNDPQKKAFCKGRSGILNGRNLMNDEFTLASFRLNLGKYSIVHIASHFYLNVGSENDSFLLLGGKDEERRKLTMAAVRKDLNMKFAGVELLTLSACDTAMSSGDKANGAEIESFGALAQDQGAKSVLATLWPIADPSTRDLMTALYRNLTINRRTGKASALRKAQLALLQGRYKAGETPLWRRELKMELGGVADSKLPLFKWDAKARYAHPYYWSPFVLMGDWR